MSAVSDIEKLYNPSMWSKRLPSSIICESHVELTKKYSADATKSITCSLNNRYGTGDRELYDIFGLDLNEGSPIFIYIHGGYWQTESVRHSNYSYISTNLHKNGIKTICIGYELCPNVTIHEIEKNIGKALTKCLEYAKDTKARHIHLAGHSAGAQLVANLFHEYIPSLPATDQKLFKSAFLLAGVYDLTPLLESSINILLKLDYENAIRASTLHRRLTKNSSAFFVVVAEYDSPALVEQGNKMHEHLKILGLNSKLLMINNVDHFDLVEKLVDDNYELSKVIIETILK